MSLCETGGLKALLDTLRGATDNARGQAGALADVARETRSVSTAANAENPNFATATGVDFGTGAALGSDSAGVGSTPPTTTGLTGGTPSMKGVLIQGLRNRLFLKYAGIDYEFYNFFDTVYR